MDQEEFRKRPRDESEHSERDSPLPFPDSPPKRVRQDIQDTTLTLTTSPHVVTNSPELTYPQQPPPLPLLLLEPPKRSERSEDCNGLRSGIMLTKDIAEDTMTIDHLDQAVFEPQKGILTEATVVGNEEMNFAHPSSSSLSTSRGSGKSIARVPPSSTPPPQLDNQGAMAITTVYGLPNLGVACHAIASTQLLAATASVQQCVDEIRSNIEGSNNPSVLISEGIVSVTNKSENSRKIGVGCLDKAHKLLSPDQSGKQDDAGDFMDKAMFELGLHAPKLHKTHTCNVCSRETIDVNHAHDFRSALWHIKATADRSVEEGLLKAFRFEVDKLCAECGKNTNHDVIIQVQKPQTVPVIAIVIDRADVDGKVNLDRVSFPLTLRGVGLGGYRRLVGICSHSGKKAQSGHYVATARRFIPVKRPAHEDNNAPLIDVPVGTFLRFNDGCAPTPVSLQDIADDERKYKTTVLLYEIAPEGYKIEENLPQSVRRHSSASSTVIDVDVASSTTNLESLAILNEKVLYRGDTRQGRPSKARLEKAHRTIKIILKRLIEEEGDENVFVADPKYVLRGQDNETVAGESSIIHGQCQLGKTGVTLLLCWIAHFIYDTVPVVIVKSAGGSESISQFSGAIDDFNKKIYKIFADEPGLSEEAISSIMEFYLIAARKPGVQAATHMADIDESIFNKGGAQVLFRLLNATNMSVYLTNGREGGYHPRSGDFRAAERLYDKLNSEGNLWHKESLSKGRVRLTVLFDEGDMTVTTSDRDENHVERQLFVLGLQGQLKSLINSEWSVVESVHHCVFITATPATLFFTASPKSLVRVISLPIKKDYFGFSEHVPLDRRFCIKNGSVIMTAEDKVRFSLSNGEPDYLSNHSGIKTMADSVMDDLRGNKDMRRMMLINAESRLKGQHGIQDGLINLARDRDFHQGIIVVAHNGGNMDSTLGGFKFACSIKSYGISDDILSKFKQPESEATANDVFTWGLCKKLMMNKHENNVSTRIQGTTVGFRRGIDIRDILTMINRAAKLAHQKNIYWPLVCIVTGAMGGRGISYKDVEHEMYLTDEYLYINPGSSRQHASIQLASRICGRYPQLIEATQENEEPPFKLWCSLTTWKLISGMVQLEDEIVRVARDAYFEKKPVFRALHSAHFERFDHIDHLKQLRIAAPRVMRYWKGRDSKRLADHTIVVAKSDRFWDIRLNKFFWRVCKSNDVPSLAARPPTASPLDNLKAEVGRSASALQVVKWTPAVIQGQVNKCQMINGISVVVLDNIATELVECILTDTDSKELELLMQRADRYQNGDPRIITFTKRVLDSSGFDSTSTISNLVFLYDNTRNISHSMCPTDYLSGDHARHYSECTSRFVPARGGKSGRIWVIRRRRSLKQIRELPFVNGTRTVLWHRFETSEDDDGMEDPSVHLLARIEYDPTGNFMAAREALESSALRTSWKPVYKNALFEDSDDEWATYTAQEDNLDLTEHYEILEIPAGSTLTVTKDAYRKLALSNHPDKGGDEEMFKKITNSYEILCDHFAEEELRDDDEPPIIKPRPFASCLCGKRDVQVVKGGFLDRRHARRCAQAASFNDEIRKQSMKSTNDKDSKKPSAIESLLICVKCLKPGVLFCCDGCPRSFCSPCYGKNESPAEVPWYCGKCTESIPDEAKKANDEFKYKMDDFIPEALDIDEEIDLLLSKSRETSELARLKSERVTLIEKFYQSLDSDPLENHRLHSPSLASTNLHLRLNEIEKYVLSREGYIDFDLNLSGRRGFLSVGSIVYDRQTQQACKIVSIKLSPSAHHNQFLVSYVVGQPDINEILPGVFRHPIKLSEVPSVRLVESLEKANDLSR